MFNSFSNSGLVTNTKAWAALRGNRAAHLRTQRSAKPASYDSDEYYTRKARKDGVPARSYYKLEELDRRLQLLKPGHRVLDLGCWPGSWTLYAAQRVGPSGRVMGIDLQEVTIDLPKHAKTVIQDAYAFRGGKVPQLDVVISDMAPKTIGQPQTDHMRSAELVRLAISIADIKLKVGGSMIAKLFDGAETKELLKELKVRYETSRIMRPSATRSQSYEIYLVGIGKRPCNVATPSTWKAPERAPKPRTVPVPHSFDGW